MPEFKAQRWVPLEDNSYFMKIGSSRETAPTSYPAQLTSPPGITFDYDSVQLPGHISYNVIALPVYDETDPLSRAKGVHTRTVIDFSIISELSFNSWLENWFESAMKQTQDSADAASALNFYDIDSEKNKRRSIFEYEYHRQKEVIENRLGITVGSSHTEPSSRKVIENFIPGAFIADNNLISPFFDDSGSFLWNTSGPEVVEIIEKRSVKFDSTSVSGVALTSDSISLGASGDLFRLSFQLQNSFEGGLNIALGGLAKQAYAIGKTRSAPNVVLESYLLDDINNGAYLALQSDALAAVGYNSPVDPNHFIHQFERVYQTNNFMEILIAGGGGTGPIVFSAADEGELTGISNNGGELPNSSNRQLNGINLEISDVSLLQQDDTRYTLNYYP